MSTATLTAIAQAATVGAVAFVDSINAVEIIRAAGDAYEQSTGVFFKVAAASVLYLGDDQARAAAKSIWPDSKHKSREYFLKVARAVVAAQKAGRAEQVAAVASFSALQALGKVAAEPAANDEQQQPLESIAAQAAALAEQGKRASGEISRLNKAMNALEAIEAAAHKATTVATGSSDATVAALASAVAIADDYSKVTKADMAAVIAALLAERNAFAAALLDGADQIHANVANVRAVMTGDEQPATDNAPAADLQAA